jgi:DNA mismatch endonuclease (patch repair protein)
VDNVSKRQRSEIMAAVKSKGNLSTERAVAHLFRANKITGWRRHLGVIPGKPDFSFLSARLAVFVDGCFWHGCKICRRNMKPSTNSAYWLTKIARNKARDHKVNAELRRAGWRVIRIWEHEVSKAPDKIIRLLQKTLVRGKHEKETGHLQPRGGARKRREARSLLIR